MGTGYDAMACAVLLLIMPSPTRIACSCLGPPSTTYLQLVFADVPGNTSSSALVPVSRAVQEAAVCMSLVHPNVVSLRLEQAGDHWA